MVNSDLLRGLISNANPSRKRTISYTFSIHQINETGLCFQGSFCTSLVICLTFQYTYSFSELVLTLYRVCVNISPQINYTVVRFFDIQGTPSCILMFTWLQHAMYEIWTTTGHATQFYLVATTSWVRTNFGSCTGQQLDSSISQTISQWHTKPKRIFS